MEIGKLGIKLNTYAIIAFVLALLGQTLLCGLVLGFVLAKEADEWATRQCLQAFCLSLLSGVLGLMLSNLATSSASMMSYRPVAVIGAMLLSGLIPGILSIVVLIFTIMGLARVVKCREAEVPIVSKWAWKASGKMQPVKAPPQNYGGQGYYGQPGGPQQAPGAGYTGAPMAPPPASPIPQSPTAPAAPAQGAPPIQPGYPTPEAGGMGGQPTGTGGYPAPGAFRQPPPPPPPTAGMQKPAAPPQYTSLGDSYKLPGDDTGGPAQ